MVKNSIERRIVANLGWRYRLAVYCRKQLEISGDAPEELDWVFAQESEAWNAFQSSRRILYGATL